jgi:hypothetical protein
MEIKLVYMVHYLNSWQMKVNAPRELQSATGEELSPLLHCPCGDATQSALLPSIFDKALRGDKCEHKQPF